MCIYIYIYMCVCAFVCVSIHPSIYLYLSIYIYVSIYLSIHLSIDPPISLSIWNLERSEVVWTSSYFLFKLPHLPRWNRDTRKVQSE